MFVPVVVATHSKKESNAMSLVPKSKQGKVTFFKSKIAPWTTSATQIGTTTTAVTALDALVDAAEAAVDAQVAAEAAFRSAVETADLAVEAMTTAGADIISAVRTKARTGGDVVYTLAQIPIPPTPAPRPAPGAANDFKVKLQADGSIDVTWKGDNAGSSGVQYQVWRRIGDVGEFTFLCGTGTRMFTDATIPAGSAQVTYQVRATRPTGAGPWAQYNVNFGNGVPPTVMQTAVSPMKAA
jgi:hypothetical protein